MKKQEQGVRHQRLTEKLQKQLTLASEGVEEIEYLASFLSDDDECEMDVPDELQRAISDVETGVNKIAKLLDKYRDLFESLPHELVERAREFLDSSVGTIREVETQFEQLAEHFGPDDGEEFFDVLGSFECLDAELKRLKEVLSEEDEEE